MLHRRRRAIDTARAGLDEAGIAASAVRYELTPNNGTPQSARLRIDGADLVITALVGTSSVNNPLPFNWASGTLAKVRAGQHALTADFVPAEQVFVDNNALATGLPAPILLAAGQEIAVDFTLGAALPGFELPGLAVCGFAVSPRRRPQLARLQEAWGKPFFLSFDVTGTGEAPVYDAPTHLEVCSLGGRFSGAANVNEVRNVDLVLGRSQLFPAVDQVLAILQPSGSLLQPGSPMASLSSWVRRGEQISYRQACTAGSNARVISTLACVAHTKLPKGLAA